MAFESASWKASMRINDGVADGANQPPAPAPIHEHARELSDIPIPRFDYDSKRVDPVSPGIMDLAAQWATTQA